LKKQFNVFGIKKPLSSINHSSLCSRKIWLLRNNNSANGILFWTVVRFCSTDAIWLLLLARRNQSVSESSVFYCRRETERKREKRKVIGWRTTTRWERDDFILVERATARRHAVDGDSRGRAVGRPAGPGRALDDGWLVPAEYTIEDTPALESMRRAACRRQIAG